MYWMNPLQYFTTAILINEFTAGRPVQAAKSLLSYLCLCYAGARAVPQ